MRKLCLIFTVCLSIGCGSGDAVPTPKIVELLTVKDSQGTEKQIPSSELYESTQGDLPVEEILVIDRQTNKQLFVRLDQIPSATQSAARYIPVTTSQPSNH
ncbi:MAG TPA: hypothetical protein VLA12_07345 [Planctomycetaceae bacterium]|nr:hypothetical protein [Planctomycetaceae bacterium]